MKSELQKEHHWLSKLVGEWEYESEGTMGPDQPPLKSTGTEVVRSLSGMWAICESQDTMPDGSMWTWIISLGYDPAKKCYVGTFFGSMMPSLWIYEGQLDSEEKVLTLSVEGPSFIGEGTAQYRDVVEVQGKDQRTMTSSVQMPDGTWFRFKTMTYRRKK